MGRVVIEKSLIEHNKPACTGDQREDIHASKYRFAPKNGLVFVLFSFVAPKLLMIDPLTLGDFSMGPPDKDGYVGLDTVGQSRKKSIWPGKSVERTTTLIAPMERSRRVDVNEKKVCPKG